MLACLGIGPIKDEAWAELKNVKKGSKEIVELAGEAEKLPKLLHPRDEEASKRHVIDAFLGALERPLTAEEQKLGCCTPEEVSAAARRIEKILEEQTDSKMECLISTMQYQIRIVKKDLKDAYDQLAAHKAAATPTAGLAAVPAPTAAAAQPPPPAPARHLYQKYPEEPPYYRPPRWQSDRRSPRCFLCEEEGHFVSNCLARPVLQHLLHQQASANTRGPPGRQILELPLTGDDSQNPPNVQLNC